MQPYWIKFEDGSKGSCEGQSAFDAKVIAEKIAGKKVAAKSGAKTNTWSAEGFEIATLPYPAEPSIWKFDHPAHGKCPSFCYKPDECAGRTACPRNRACDD